MEELFFPDGVIGQKFIWDTRYPQKFIQIQVDSVIVNIVGLQQQYCECITCYYLSKSFYSSCGNTRNDSLSSVNINRTLDVSSSGDRWEGDVKDESSYGYGVLYNGKGEKVYEGFMFNGINQGYGCTYYPDSCQAEYIGTFYNGKRQGYGRLYDRKGNAVYEGKWMNDSSTISQRIVIPEEMSDFEGFHSYIETVVISKSCGNDQSFESLSITAYSRLKSIHIQDDCFQYVKALEICHNPCLESIDIESNCFHRSSMNDSPENQKSFDSGMSCVIQHCNQLSHITIGQRSFECYSKLDLKGFIHCVII